jgi:hypothetical protein
VGRGLAGRSTPYDIFTSLYICINISSEDMTMRTTTLRLPDHKLKLLKAIAGYEGSSMSKILEQMTDEFILRHRETMELLSVPGFVRECQAGYDEVKKGKGKRLNELDD